MKRLARPGDCFTVARARLATFLTEPADTTGFFCFVLMHGNTATIVPNHRRCKPPAYGSRRHRSVTTRRSRYGAETPDRPA
jgi:hypothetical protein